MVSRAIAKANEDEPESIYWVEQIAQAKGVQAVPMLEAKFVRTQESLDKAHIASALVRLGDRSDVYWDFLLQLARQTVESDAPDYMSYDPQGRAIPGPSREFSEWAAARNLRPTEMAQEQMYLAPGAVALLGLTGDPRAIPVLRRGLLSPNHQIQIMAAKGLAEIGDKNSIPFIVKACQKAPAEPAAAIAGSLVYFDHTEAQTAVDEFVPKDIAKMHRQARTDGKGPFGNIKKQP